MSAAVLKWKADEPFAAKRLTSYSSHTGWTSKMWILPDGKPVSIPSQHYAWALKHAAFLQQHFNINIRNVRRKGDTPIRLHLLRHGCVRVNYEHKGGHLTCEAYHLRWGNRQIKGCRAIIRANLDDISFVVIRLLNARCAVVREAFTKLTGCSLATAMKSVPTRLKRPGGPGERRSGRHGKVGNNKP